MKDTNRTRTGAPATTRALLCTLNNRLQGALLWNLLKLLQDVLFSKNRALASSPDALFASLRFRQYRLQFTLCDCFNQNMLVGKDLYCVEECIIRKSQSVTRVWHRDVQSISGAALRTAGPAVAAFKDGPIHVSLLISSKQIIQVLLCRERLLFSESATQLLECVARDILEPHIIYL